MANKHAPRSFGTDASGRAAKGLFISSRADKKAQPGIEFELIRRKTGDKMKAGQVNKLRMSAEQGNESAIKAYEAYTQSKGLFKRNNGRGRGPLPGK